MRPRHYQLRDVSGRVVLSTARIAVVYRKVLKMQIGTITDLYFLGRKVDTLVNDISGIWHKGADRTPGLITASLLVTR